MADKLEGQRREYRSARLSRDNLNDDPFIQFDRWMNEALSKDQPDPTAMTVSTIGKDGRPWSRIVLLKGSGADGLRFFTNLESHKARDIAGNPNVTLHFPWLQMERQVIVGGTAELLPRAETQAYFASRPRESCIAAWVSSQSEEIPSREFLDNAYATMTKKFEGKEVPAPDFWGGYRVIPDTFEFWQGGEHRLHDRFRFEKTGDDWRIARLSP